MSLLVFFRNDPRFDSVKDHVIYRYPVSEMDRLLYSQNTKNFKLDASKVVKQCIKLNVLSC